MRLKHLLGIYMCQYANYMDNITRVYVMLMLLDYSFITRKDNRLVLKHGLLKGTLCNMY